MAKTVPGTAGWTITGDRTVEFAKHPLDFIEKRINQHSSKVFQARALNIPTVFICSNKGTKEILHEKEGSFNMGYKDFGYIYQLYGDLLLFYDGVDAMRVRSIMERIFDQKKCHCYAKQVESNSIPLYETFKNFTTALSLQLFLDLDWRSAKMEFETIKSISILHWHGLISVPLSVRVRGWSSSFSKAIEAKEYLLKFIYKKLNASGVDCHQESFMANAKEAGFKNEDETIHHILLFVSALIPKALASLLTSFCIAMSGADKSALRTKALEDDSFLDDVLLEVQRLWPPFLGGRRITNEEVVIDGYKIPANTPIAFMTWFANRDSDVFENPYSFHPERWQHCEKEKRELVWTFGGGKRVCVGVDLINRLLKVVCKKLMREYDWSLAGSQDLSYKTLPVSRPRQTVMACFKCRT